MVAGRMEAARQLLLSHGWVIGQLFASTPPAQSALDEFVRYGVAGDESGDREELPPEVHEKVAEMLRTGEVRFG